MSPRLSKARAFLKGGIDAILVSSVPNIIYLTEFSNFSKDEREAFLLFTKNSSYILTDGRYSEAVRKSVKKFKLIEISPTLSLKEAFLEIKNKHKILKVGIEENNLTVAEYKKFGKIFKLTSSDLNEVRTVKDPSEISKIKKACEIGDLAYSHILKKLRIGVTENEIALKIESFIKSKGATLSFDSIVAFGANSSVPHHQTGKTKLKKGDIVLLDFGVKLENYYSDMTRTVFFGKATDKQKKIYQTVLEAQTSAIKALHDISIYDPSKERASKIDKIARDYIISKGYPTIPHSLGHGIGLEVHEDPHLSPRSKGVLKEGMVFSIEPGIYIKNFGGVRIEDLVVLTTKGAKLLTHSPRTILQLAKN